GVGGGGVAGASLHAELVLSGAAVSPQEAQGGSGYHPRQNRRRASPRLSDSRCYPRRFEQSSLTCFDRLAEEWIQKQIGIHAIPTHCFGLARAPESFSTLMWMVYPLLR